MKISYNTGSKFVATVKAVRSEGVYIKMHAGGSGLISSKCWGSGMEMARALAMIKPGDKVPVVVKSYNRACRVLSLLLDGGLIRLDSHAPREAKGFRRFARRPVVVKKEAAHPAKAAYRPIPAGSTLLLDIANLLGAIGPADAARNLGIIASSLEQRGFVVALFLERRTWGWGMHNQESEQQVAAWREFLHDSRLSLVDGESDLAMLQVASVVGNAYVCTRDHLADYAETYPEIVKERRRSFSVTNLGGRTIFAIEGLVDAIAIDPEDSKPEAKATPTQSERMAEESDDATLVPCEKAEPTGQADVHATHARIANPVRYLGRMAEKDHCAYRALARHFSGTDTWLERKYLRLAAAAERRGRETRIRDERRYKAARRGVRPMGHFSRQRRYAIGIAEFARVHDDIASRLAASRQSRVYFDQRAA